MFCSYDFGCLHRKPLIFYIKICILAITSFLLVGAFCSCNGAKATLSQSVDSNTANAIVKSVDGKIITLNIMPSMGSNMPGGGQGGPGMQGGQGGGGGQGGTPPEKPSGESNNSNSGSVPPDLPNENGQGNQLGGSNSQRGLIKDASNSAQGGTDMQGGGGSQNGGIQGGGQGGSNMPGGGQGGPGMQGGQGGLIMLPDMNQDSNNVEATLTINDESIIEKQDGNKAKISDISQGSNLELSVENSTNVTKIIIKEEISGMQQSDNVVNGGAAFTVSEDQDFSNQNFSSTNSDENSFRVENSAQATLDDCIFEKSGDTTSSENSDFYGMNAIAYVWNSAKMLLNNAKLNSNSKGSNGVFVYGNGASAVLNNTKISTTSDNSGGIEVSGGGSIEANNLTVETQGGSSAAIRSDRGGGTESVNGGSYISHGQGSPAIYCTADVNIKDAYLESEISEVNVIEGKNSINLEGCKLNCNTQGKYFRGDNIRNIMLYQSMSGDAEQGTCNYTAKNCNYNTSFGNVFYITNTSAVINLENTIFNGACDAFMKIAGNTENWGQSGKNGGDVTLNCNNQKVDGAITVDNISKLQLNLTNNSNFEGSINNSGQNGSVNITMDNSSKFTLNEDTYISSLSGDTTGITLNGHTLYVNGTAWNN